MPLRELTCACGCGETIFKAGALRSKQLYATCFIDGGKVFLDGHQSKPRLCGKPCLPHRRACAECLVDLETSIIDEDGTAHGYTAADDELHDEHTD